MRAWMVLIAMEVVIGGCGRDWEEAGPEISAASGSMMSWETGADSTFHAVYVWGYWKWVDGRYVWIQLRPGKQPPWACLYLPDPWI